MEYVTPQNIAIFIIMILSMGLHEAAHAKVAGYWGDSTPTRDGVNTWNPIPHLLRSAMNSIIIPALLWFTAGVFIGGAYVLTNPQQMRNPKWGDISTSAAGPGMNLFLSIILGSLGIVFYLINPAWQQQAKILIISGAWNFFIFLFNMIPLPPLDGSHIFVNLFPSTRRFFARVGAVGFLLLFLLLMFFPPFRQIFWMPVNKYYELCTVIIQHFS